MATTKARPLFDPPIVRRALVDSLVKLHPRRQVRNPVMFTVYVGSILTTGLGFHALYAQGQESPAFIFGVSAWLWFTVLFANFAEAMAEGRGKAQADTLRRARTQTSAKLFRLPLSVAGSERSSTKLLMSGAIEICPANELRIDKLVFIEAGDMIPADGEVVEGVASVDESAITGESAPVIREAGGDRSSVTGGTRVLSDWLIVRVSANPGETFLDRMIALVEGAKRQKTPNEIALDILLAAMTIIFLVVCVTLFPYSVYSVNAAGQGIPVTVTVLVALLVCLIPTTIGGLLSAIGIAGMDRMIQANVIAMSGRAVEAAGDVDVLLLDKTGTITLGNRQAVELIPAPGVDLQVVADAAQLASLADETPEGRSIVVLAKEKYQLRGRNIHDLHATFIPFSAQTRTSGVDIEVGEAVHSSSREGVAWVGEAPAEPSLARGSAGASPSQASPSQASPSQASRSQASPSQASAINGARPTTQDGNGHQAPAKKPHREIRKGAADAIEEFVRNRKGQIPAEVRRCVEEIAKRGGTPLVVAEGSRTLGVIYLKDIVKGGIKERFSELRRMGIKTVMITGDNPLTASAIAAEAGVDDFLAQATPEAKLKMIREFQASGRLVAMTGDGTNDSPALAQADVAVAMNSGTQAAKEAGNMVDLDSNPTKLIEIVEIGKQLLITRGALTTFSLANDVAKYFAIIPAAFASTYPVLDKLNVMRLATPASAILSAVIFNALIIIFLIPLALRGIKYRPVGAARLLRDNLLIYGLGGLVVPFVGIKLIDLILVGLHLT